MDSIRNRRTIRKYKQQDIPAELLNGLLEEAFRASTMGNMQLYSVVVTRDAERKALLAPAHFNQPMVTSAPVVLTFCADFNRFSKWCRQRKAEPGYDNLISFIMPLLIPCWLFRTSVRWQKIVVSVSVIWEQLYIIRIRL